MKRDMLILISILIVFVFFMLLLTAASPFTKESSRNVPKKQFDKTRLLEYITLEEKERYDFNESSWSSSYPPLRPERFRRRMKMLFAIDINDYPENAWIRIIGDRSSIEEIYYAGEFISIKEQAFYLLDKIVKPEDQVSEAPSPFGGMEDDKGEDYGTVILDYLFYDDLAALDSMKTYKYRLIKEFLGEKWEGDEWAGDLLPIYDIPYKVYSFIHTAKLELIRYVDKNKDITDDSRYIRTDYEVGNYYRASALRSDLQLLYLLEEKKKDRQVICNSYNTLDDISIDTDPIIVSFFRNSYNYLPWRKNTLERSIAEYMTFLVQIQEKELNKFVIQYMSGQFETFEDKVIADSLRSQIRTNNYYGHTVLREFCENPEREMPTLEKVGTSFNACVTNPNTLLYLEPYPDSYDIGTIQPSETFKAYEMGYDDYYLVEVVKPVESPIAGPDGYAMILDRTETVYGYIKKKEVKEVSELDMASQKIKAQTGKRKVGLIDDPDVFVNIRKESNTESEIIGKITEKEIFFYWEIAESNWWYVQTKDNLHGFVHKSRIKEKIDAGSWILDDTK